MTSEIQSSIVKVNHIYEGENLKITPTDWAVSVVTGGKVKHRLNDFLVVQGVDEKGENVLWRGYLLNEDKGNFLSAKVIAQVRCEDLSKVFTEDATKLNYFYEEAPHHLTTKITAEIGNKIVKQIKEDEEKKHEVTIVEDSLSKKFSISISDSDETEQHSCWADWVLKRVNVPDREKGGFEPIKITLTKKNSCTLL